MQDQSRGCRRSALPGKPPEECRLLPRLAVLKLNQERPAARPERQTAGLIALCVLCWGVWWWLSAHEFPLTLGDATHLLGSAVNCHLTGAASRCPSRAINLTRRVVRTTKTTTIYIPACHQCGKSTSHPKTTVELCGCSAHSRTSTNLTLTPTFTSS